MNLLQQALEMNNLGLKPKIHKKKVTGKTAVTKKPADHPKYSEMVHQALASLKERGGSHARPF